MEELVVEPIKPQWSRVSWDTKSKLEEELVWSSCIDFTPL